MKLLVPLLYKNYFIDTQDERRQLFQKLSEKYSIRNGLYPGSFVHITPSFFINQMTYIDNDKRCASFFGDKTVKEYIDKVKTYKEKSMFKFIDADFTKDLAIDKGNYDLLVSLYAGFISQQCKSYLMKNGILIVNNSHGDAALAYLDKSYSLVSVIMRKGSRFTFLEDRLENYFQTKNKVQIDRDKVLKSMRGLAYS